MAMSRISVAVVICLLIAGAHAQVPEEREENCGSLLTTVISVCSHPTLARPDWCCNELKRWNDARCWCEPNAFDALDTVAANGYAFSFRDTFCKEAFQRPSRGSILPEHATCDPFESVEDSDGMEQCTDITPAELRTQRFVSLDALRDDKVADATDLAAWFSRMDVLFSEDATYEEVGIFLGRGRFEVKQYLMTRQEAYGFMPATADFTGDHFWRSPNMVSYTRGATTARGYFNKREFVKFEACSARIAAVYSLEDNYQTRYGQFWDAASTRLMSRYDRTAESWCAEVSSRCTGSAYPFGDEAGCQTFYTTLANEGRITCNKFEQEYVPQYAAHGDTIACRSFYLDLAVVDAGGACSSVGEIPNQARCGTTQCPGDSYMDPFARDAGVPQFETAASFTCGATSCRENWPSAEQILAMPEGERPEIVAAEDAETVAAVVLEMGSAGEDPASAEEIATDADSGIDTNFENDVPERRSPTRAENTFVADTIAV